MRVLAESTWDWMLFEDSGKLYLDVMIEQSAVSYSITTVLSPEQAGAFELQGQSVLAPIIATMRSAAHAGKWRVPSLPPDWKEKSISAAIEWRRALNS